MYNRQSDRHTVALSSSIQFNKNKIVKISATALFPVNMCAINFCFLAGLLTLLRIIERLPVNITQWQLEFINILFLKKLTAAGLFRIFT